MRDFAAEMRANLADPITPLLATGAMASALLGSPLDAALVGGVLLANAALSAEQQLHAERILRRLLAVQDPLARRRIGRLDERRHEKVAAKRLHPGDIIEVHPDEVIPADARLIEASNVEVDESTLTGESLPVAKQTDPTPGAPLAERACMLYAGSTLVAGTAVGSRSEMRRALAMAPTKSREIGLQRQLSRITRRALPFSVGGGAVVGLLKSVHQRSCCVISSCRHDDPDRGRTRRRRIPVSLPFAHLYCYPFPPHQPRHYHFQAPGRRQL